MWIVCSQGNSSVHVVFILSIYSFSRTPPSRDRTRVIMAIGRVRAENIDFLMRASASERLEI
jgi:hypothetical protein